MPTVDVETIESTTIKLSEPGFYNIILHNDDTTTFEFVIHILTDIFHHTLARAEEITTEIHKTGYGTAGGPYTKEVAEEKIQTINKLSYLNRFPLKATVELA